MSETNEQEYKHRVSGSELSGIVILRCSRPGCMRTENIHFDSTMPEGTTEIKMACPTHQRDGDFLEESYYNEHGQWFGPNGWQ